MWPCHGGACIRQDTDGVHPARASVLFRVIPGATRQRIDQQGNGTNDIMEESTNGKLSLKTTPWTRTVDFGISIMTMMPRIDHVKGDEQAG